MHLESEKAKKPTVIPYVLSILGEYPLNVVLAYITPTNKVMKEFARVKPRGFWFHNQNYPTLQHLIGWFKENFKTIPYRKFAKKQKSPRAIDFKSTLPQVVVEEQKDWKNVDSNWVTNPGLKADTPYAAPTQHVPIGGNTEFVSSEYDQNENMAFSQHANAKPGWRNSPMSDDDDLRRPSRQLDD